MHPGGEGEAQRFLHRKVPLPLKCKIKRFKYDAERTYLCCSQLLHRGVLELEQLWGKNVGKAISQLQEGCIGRTPFCMHRWARLSAVTEAGTVAWAVAGEHTFCITGTVPYLNCSSFLLLL